jgi:hypothetical protein
MKKIYLSVSFLITAFCSTSVFAQDVVYTFTCPAVDTLTRTQDGETSKVEGNLSIEINGQPGNQITIVGFASPKVKIVSISSAYASGVIGSLKITCQYQTNPETIGVFLVTPSGFSITNCQSIGQNAVKCQKK